MVTREADKDSPIVVLIINNLLYRDILYDTLNSKFWEILMLNLILYVFFFRRKNRVRGKGVKPNSTTKRTLNIMSRRILLFFDTYIKILTDTVHMICVLVYVDYP